MLSCAAGPESKSGGKQSSLHGRYLHLVQDWGLIKSIVFSWLIALAEYSFQGRCAEDDVAACSTRSQTLPRPASVDCRVVIVECGTEPRRSLFFAASVPANRIGHAHHGGPFSAPVLKIVIAEFWSLTTFGVFSVRSCEGD